MVGKPWEYLFFLDLQGHQQDEAVGKALDEAAAQAHSHKTLGSFPRARSRPRLGRAELSVALEKVVKPHILDLKPYEPGKPMEELERELGISESIKLASNENPHRALSPGRGGLHGRRSRA